MDGEQLAAGDARHHWTTGKPQTAVSGDVSSSAAMMDNRMCSSLSQLSCFFHEEVAALVVGVYISSYSVIAAVQYAVADDCVTR